MRARVRDRLVDARAGVVRPLIVVGEPGSGKTTLLDHLVDGATGWAVIRVRPHEADAGVAYAAVREALLSLVAGGLASPAEQAVVAVADSMDPLHAGDRATVIGLLVRALTVLEVRSPVVMCVDDLHLADPETAAVFWYLVRHVREARICIAGATRSGPPYATATGAEQLERLASSGSIDLVTMPPFTAADVVELVVDAHGVAPAPDLVTLLVRRAGGNAFYTVHLLDALVAGGAVVVSAGTLELAGDHDVALPRAVTGSVLARVEAVGGRAGVVAGRLAVLGAVSLGRMPVLANLADLGVAETEDAFDDLVRAGLVIERERRFVLSHELIRDALQAELGPARRRRLHDLAAKLLADDADVVELAHHVRAASSAPDPASAQVLADAGEVVARESPAAAIRWYRDALTLADGNDAIATQITLALSRALGLVGQCDEAVELALGVLRAGAGEDQRRRAVELAVTALRACGRLHEAAALLDEGLAVTPPEASARLLLQRAQLALWSEDLGAARRHVVQAEMVGVEEHSSSLAEVVKMHLDVAACTYRSAWERSERLRRLDVPTTERGNVRVSLMVHTAANGDPAVALDDVAAVRSAGLMEDVRHAMAAWTLWRLGRWAEAIRQARASLERSTGRDAHAETFARAVLIAIAAEQDRAHDVVDHVQAIEVTSLHLAFADWAIARCAAAQGDHDAAMNRLAEAVARTRAIGRMNYLHHLLSTRAQLAHDLGDAETAHDANAELQALPRDERAVAANVDALLTQAIVEADEGAAARAVGLTERHQLSVDGATALAVLAELRADADQLAQAHDLLAALGAVARQRRVARRLRQHGHRVRVHSPPGALTASERDVVALVGHGHTNREIASITGLTPKTVETYVSRILAKTGHRSRTQLAVAVTTGELR